MDFALDPDQQQLCDQLRRFAARELREPLARSAAEGTFHEPGWRACAELGIFGLLAPAAHGGAEHDALTAALALEALGRGCEDNGFLFSVGVQILAAILPVQTFGSEAQRREHLGAMIEGRTVGALCASEAEAGSDLLALRTTAARDGDHVVMDGAKAWITNAPLADLLIVLARDEDAGAVAPVKGISAFLVARDTAGVVVGPPTDKLGLRGSPMADVQLQQCRVPASCRLGPVGAGYTIFNTVMQWERVLLPCIYLGVMEAQLERTCAHVRQRRQFDQPLAGFQAVGHALADMYARLESSRLLLYRAAWLMARRRQAALEGAAAKLVASEGFKRNSERALQLHGAAGYTRELNIERQLRDAVAATIYSGTSEVQRSIIARLLGGR